ncbi:MAG: type III secretion system export apparatus subunit SctV [Deltaproteobacteria bacterium]|nr:type III secretion system export apparatus subunit SctV [Deltaproteobacteria bacterium]
MKLFQSLAALPPRAVSRHPDVLVAIGISLITAMLIVPVPGLVIDALIPLNIGFSLLILLVAIFAKNALEVTTFPTLLLISTLFRLGINVSTTRGILTKADAGEMVKAFGEFVVRGDVVIGLVMFLVITVVQFLVIAKGSERVAEVGARFTLDAMPGKQMSIDAAVRAGALTEQEAQDKREDLNRASMLFGSMDGAMKFVKGDAIAALVITALNITAGIVIGVTRMGMSAGEAVELYSVLTIGDGLVAQIAALLVTLSAGIIVTRVESKDKTKNLGHNLKDELFSNAKVLNIGAGLMVLLALVPGLPALPFLLCAGLALSASMSAALFPRLSALHRSGAGGNLGTLAKQEAFKAMLDKKVEDAKKQKSLVDRLAPTVVPIGIDLDPSLSLALGFKSEETDDDAELVSVYIPQLRDALYLETGVRFPGVRVRPHVKSLPEGTFMVRIDDVPVMQEKVSSDLLLATVPPERLERLGVEAKPIQHPVSKAKMALIPAAQKTLVEAAGITVWDLSGMVALYVAAILRKRAKDFIGLQEVSELVERLEKAYPALVKEVIPKVTTIPQLLSVLRRLVDEGVSIRNMRSIIEALGEYGTRDGDTVFLTEKVRAALGPQIAYNFAGLGNALPVVLLDPVIEETVMSGISSNQHGQVLAIEPQICREIVQAVLSALQPVVAKGKRPVLLTNSEIRRYVKKLVEVDLPSVAVLSFDELPLDLTIQPMGRASLAAN